MINFNELLAAELAAYLVRNQDGFINERHELSSRDLKDAIVEFFHQETPKAVLLASKG